MAFLTQQRKNLCLSSFLFGGNWCMSAFPFFFFFLKKKVTDPHQVLRAQLQINNSVLSYTSWGSACKSEGIINAIASRDIPIWLLLNENRTGSFCQKFFFWVDQKSLWAVCLCACVYVLIVPPHHNMRMTLNDAFSNCSSLSSAFEDQDKIWYVSAFFACILSGDTISQHIWKLDGCVHIFIISQIPGNHATNIWSNSLALFHT